MTSRMLLRNLAGVSHPARHSVAIRRAFTSSPESRHKETDHNTDQDIEKHKQDLLTKQKSGKGHWKPELASDSEEAVKADRSVDTYGEEKGPDAMKKLQERTKQAAEERSKAGTSMRDGL